MSEKPKIRKIRFSIRLKISLVIIAATVLSSVLIIMAVFNNWEKNRAQETLVLGRTILAGADEYATTYLNSDLANFKNKDLSKEQIKAISKQQKEAIAELTNYFSSIIKKEKLIDIAFLIDNKPKKVGTNWKRKNQANYLYFDRQQDKVLYRLQNDEQLKPSIYKYYMNNVDVNPHLCFTKGRNKDEKAFVLVGSPIFKNQRDKRLYQNYVNFSKTKAKNKKELTVQQRKANSYKWIFTNRLITSNSLNNYKIHLTSKKKITRSYYFLSREYSLKNLNRTQKKQLYLDYVEIINKNLNNKTILLSDYQKIIQTLQKRYNLKLKNRELTRTELWQNLYKQLKRSKIKVSTDYSLPELAKFSFRNDLSGITGIFILRSQFYAGLNKDKNDLINLFLNILIRCIFVALFFPAFIIRSIKKLNEGAVQIGTGDFSTKIKLNNSDELGRLADVLNIMTLDLQRAQIQMLEKQRMHEELKTAQQIQETLLPTETPDFPELDFATYYSAQSEAGGDYYDFIKLNDNLLALGIADVSGHGVGSGLVMAMTRTLLHIYCRLLNSPKKVLESINQYLYENTARNYFVSMFYGYYQAENKKLIFTSAGHNPAYLLRKGKIIELPAGGMALGAVGESLFGNVLSVKSLSLETGDCLIAYTDGIVEAMNKQDQEYGEDRFKEALRKNSNLAPQKLVKATMQDLAVFTGERKQSDDITMFILKVK